MLKLLINQNRFIKWGLLVLFFVMGYIYEMPEATRQWLLILGFAIMALGFFISEKRQDQPFIGIVISLAGLLFIENYSSYVMNYFFQILYLVLLITVLLTVKRKQSWFIGAIILMASLRKYISLYNYQKRPETMAEIFFFVLMTLIVFIACSFGRYYREEKNEKETLLRQVLGQNEALRLYSEKIADLSASEERGRIARDLHDSLGHKLTGLIMELEMIDHLIGAGGQEKQLVTQAKEDARSLLSMVRQVVESYHKEELRTEGDFLTLIGDFKERSHFQVNLDNQLSGLKEVPWSLIEKITREGLTNGARHAQTDQLFISLYEKEENYVLKLWNSGIYTDVVAGNGLKGMAHRLESLGGHLEINYTEGFEIKAYIAKEIMND
jgi:signal transduction histidine kinase